MSEANGAIVNDVHSRLNRTWVARIEQPRSLAEICRAVRAGAAADRGLSICGGRHAMGGQQFGTGTTLLDLSGHKRIHTVDFERGLVKVDAGIRWPELVNGLHTRQKGQKRVWSIRQKQTGADELSLGGALAANIHGRGLTMGPIIGDVEAFTLVDARGEGRVCDRERGGELFRLAVGGYGVFGVIADVTLRLQARHKLQRRVEILRVDELAAAFDGRIAAGFTYGDFQFSIDERSRDFLRVGVFSCYQPVDDGQTAPSDQAGLERSDWERLLYLAHTDRARAYEEYARYYLSTDGQVYWSDTHQLGVYLDGYHAGIDQRQGKQPGSEMITELYVPRGKLAEFMARAAETLRERGAAVIYGTVRLIERDEESFLAWARENYACVIFNLHVDHSTERIAQAAATFRALIDLAIRCGGNFYLTYHRYANRAQVETGYPQFAEFLAEQRRQDPEGRWRSDWLTHHTRLFEEADGRVSRAPCRVG